MVIIGAFVFVEIHQTVHFKSLLVYINYTSITLIKNSNITHQLYDPTILFLDIYSKQSIYLQKFLNKNIHCDFIHKSQKLEIG